LSFSQRFEEIRTGFERPFWVANISELFERLSYYAAFASLARYLHETLNFPVEQAGSLTGLFGGLVWFLAAFGGTLADRLGFRRSLSLAYFILSCSYFILGSLGSSWIAPLRAAVPLVVLVAVVLNIIGLNVGKWLQNAGGVGTYVPLLMLGGVAALVVFRRGSVTHFTVANMMPAWNWDTVNFWSQIAFAFTGLELVSAMSEEIRDPGRTLPRAVLGSGILIAAMYIVGTFAVLALLPPNDVSPTSGVFAAVTVGSRALGVAFLGIAAAILVTVGNSGGIGSTVAGIARVPFTVGIDRYLPAPFAKIHPRWRTPYVSILVQAGVSGAVLLVSQISETARGAYQVLVDITIIVYFIPFLYMFAAAIKLSRRKDRVENKRAVLIPGGRVGVWLISGLGFLVVLVCMAVSMVPPGDSANKFLFEVKLVVGSAGAVLLGLILYWRGVRQKSTLTSQASPIDR